MDIVKRLRFRQAHPAAGAGQLVNPDGPEAADEIERLREALKKIAKTTYGYDPMTMNDEEKGVYFSRRFFNAQEVARDALKEPE